MRISQIKTVFKVMIQKKMKQTPMLWGRHGCAKSSAIRQVATEVGYRILDLRLAQKEAIDITGMLYTFADPVLKLSVTANHPPQWFADALKNGKVVLFLDEFNMARREVMNAVFELVLDRKLNNVELPDSVFIVCAGNPEDDRYQTTPMSESLIDRLIHIKATPTTDEWLAYAEQENVDPTLVSFIRANPDALYYQDKKDEKFPVTIHHSERSWFRANDILKLELDTELQYELLQGCVGVNLATLYVKTIEKHNMPVSVKDIFGGKKDVATRTAAHRKTGRNDLLAIAVNNLVDFCIKEDENGKLVNEKEATKHLPQIVEYIKMLPKESQMIIITATRFIGDKKRGKDEGWSAVYLDDKEISERLDEIGKVIRETKEEKKKAGVV